MIFAIIIITIYSLCVIAGLVAVFHLWRGIRRDKRKRIDQQKYLDLRNAELRGNIDLYPVGLEVFLKDKRIVKVVGKSANSILAFVPKRPINRNKKDKNGEPLYTHAVSSTEWFTIEEFERRFVKEK